MKKVGIITWCGDVSLNYGSALQTTAMQELIKNENCEPITMRFMNLGRSKRTVFFELLRRGRGYRKTWKLFKSWFKKNVKFSDMCYYDDEIVEYAKRNFDILLCGSDCIWGSNYNANQKFFWDYKELDGIPHISYAPGIDKGEVLYDMTRVLDQFAAISGREEKIKDALAKYNRDIKVVLDPTLSLNEKFWQKKAAKRLIKEDYVVCYFLSNVEYHWMSIELIKKKYGVEKVVCINTDFIDKPCNEVFSDYHDCDCKKIIGPAEFLSLIKYSKAVCTDSYHGTCFSIVFRKDFFIFSLKRVYKKNGDYRFDSLFSRLGINNRYVDYNYDIEKIEPIDWKSVEKVLYEERKKSIAYLSNAIKACN